MEKPHCRGEGVATPDLKLISGTVVTKITHYCHRSSHVDQWNRVENPEIDQPAMAS